MLILAFNSLKGDKMKKIIGVLIVVVLIVGCGVKDEYALGTYKERRYVNEVFNLDFEVQEGYSFLTADELKKVNEETHEVNKDNPNAVYRNRVLNLSNTDGVSLVAYVDATPDQYKNADAEANAYLDFLSEQRIAYRLERDKVELNNLEYHRLLLDLDFEKNQQILITENDGKLINIQITYPDGLEEQVELLLKSLDKNE